MVKKALIIVYSYHHKNTEKLAKVMAKVLNTEIKRPDEINSEKLQYYDLIGFGFSWLLYYFLVKKKE